METPDPLQNIFVESANADKIKLKKIVDGYLRYYAHDSTHTSRAKQLDLQKFLKCLAAQEGFSSPEKLTIEHFSSSSVKQFVEDLLAEGEAPATVSRRLATIKHMGRSLAEKIAGFTNPTQGIKAPRVNPTKPKALSPHEVKSVREVAVERQDQRQSFTRFRNQFLFEFFIETGLRADEVRLLRRGQIDESHEWIKNVRTKGKRYRNVYIPSTLRESLEQYLLKREDQLKRLFSKLTVGEDKKLPFFISLYGAKAKEPDSFLMGAKTIWRAINELSSKTPLHPHLLRHSFATDLLDSSKDVRLVSQALGHSDVRVTMRYTERTEQHIAAAMETKSKENK